MKIPNNAEEPKRNGAGIKERIIPALALLLIITISVFLFIYGRDPSHIADLKRYHKLGAFLISLIGNASVLLPGIVLPALTALSVNFYRVSGEISGPVIIGLLGGLGAAIGEIVGYAAGYSGHRIIKGGKSYERLGGWVRRWGALGIFVFSLFPLFFDLVGLIAGVIRFPLWKFVLACWAGRTILYVFVVVLAALGFKVLLPLFG